MGTERGVWKEESLASEASQSEQEYGGEKALEAVVRLAAFLNATRKGERQIVLLKHKVKGELSLLSTR